jgi:High potential iron-sulfur protein
MNLTNRRTFMIQVAAGSALAPSGAVMAQAGPILEETDAQAVALGYKHDTTKVDPKKYAKHEDSQKCATCQLFQGKSGDASGGCPLFAGKQVKSNGWCSAWAKKTA